MIEKKFDSCQNDFESICTHFVIMFVINILFTKILEYTLITISKEMLFYQYYNIRYDDVTNCQNNLRLCYS